MVAIVRVQETVKTPIDKAPEPNMGGDYIPKERYISPEFMKLEWERMWTKVWLMGCREMYERLLLQYGLSRRLCTPSSLPLNHIRPRMSKL